AVGREHRAAREAAALFDQSSFAKFILKGPDAEAALGWIAANRVDRPVGSVVYTQMLNDRGGIECDLTATRTAHNEYYIVTGTGFATHDFNWISRNIPKGLNSQLVDVTSSNSVLSLFGPRAREILAEASGADVSDAKLGFAKARRIGVAGCQILALRITYVGELGYELHIPTENARAVYDALHAAGAAHGLRNAGYRAIETLRLEKGYRAWGADIGPDHTPDEAGLGWAVKLRADTDFRGRAAAQAQRSAGVKKILATFTAPGDVILSGRETLYRNGERCGWLSSGGYGHTLGLSIGMGYVRNADGVDADYVLSGDYELEVASARVKADVTLDALYDPENSRVKA
ncbi:MAG: aminomethyltransferase family protein, partial [Pseudomonadota bacterium]